jgi:predicted ATPase
MSPRLEVRPKLVCVEPVRQILPTARAITDPLWRCRGPLREGSADITHTESEIIDEVAELVTKSRVSTDVGDAEPRLRLLDTTRAYALNKLAESGEIDAFGHRHATAGRRIQRIGLSATVGNT